MSMLSVDEALERILSSVMPTGTETVPIAEAGNRILAEPVIARLNQPPFDCSAMDGYALIAPEPVTYPFTAEIIGESAAGMHFTGTLHPGQAVRIFTGAPLPDGADTVVIQENTARTGNQVTILDGVSKGRHIRRAGLDFTMGEMLVETGTRLDARHLALTAASGNATVTVAKRPRIAILATGNELVLPGTPPGPDQIIASNNYAIGAIVRSAGGIADDQGILPDNLDMITTAIDAAIARGSDIIVTSGGASVGDHDYVAAALKANQVEIGFWKIAMRPGKPLMYGRKTISGRVVHFLGLPGNPVSSFICSLVFLRPLIATLTGLKQTVTPQPAILGVDMPTNGERRDFVRVKLESDATGGLVATPFPVQDSSMLTALARSDAILIRRENAPAARAGDDCEIVPL